MISRSSCVFLFFFIFRSRSSWKRSRAPAVWRVLLQRLLMLSSPPWQWISLAIVELLAKRKIRSQWQMIGWLKYSTTTSAESILTIPIWHRLLLMLTMTVWHRAMMMTIRFGPKSSWFSSRISRQTYSSSWAWLSQSSASWGSLPMEWFYSSFPGYIIQLSFPLDDDFSPLKFCPYLSALCCPPPNNSRSK